KSLHGAYKIGKFWDKIPHCETRGLCSLCNSPESMEHILLNYDKSPASGITWKAASDLWCKHKSSWPKIQFSTILGCNLGMLHDVEGKEKLGVSRLFKILILESAHLWKLRCERVIKISRVKEKFHSETKILNR
ncbi:uncharacterized protein BJ212DRAFT_1270310, partial [Suillus subaureus]